MKKSLVCFLIILSIFIISCEPSTTLEIRNNTSQSLEIWLFAANYAHALMNEGDSLGTIEPGSVMKKEDIAAFYSVYLFEGRDQ